MLSLEVSGGKAATCQFSRAGRNQTGESLSKEAEDDRAPLNGGRAFSVGKEADPRETVTGLGTST